jgi:hypothetical protein
VYLADLSGLYQPDQTDQPEGRGEAPAELLVETAHGGRFFNTPATLHYSADLSHWTLFDKKQILAFYGSAGANRDALALPKGETFRYLLLRMDRDAPGLEKLTARFDPAPAPAEIREKTVKGEISGGGKTVSYHTGGFYPFFEVDFALSRADSFQVTVWNRDAEEGEWNSRGGAAIFRYNSPGGEPQKNDPLSISGSAPFWEIRILGERAFTEAPEMAIRWKKKELVFLALGSAPWTLAYGNARCGPPGEGGLPVLEGGNGELLPALPTGLAAYERRPGERVKEGPGFGPWLLWGVLILAAALLSLLAFVIARSMRNG